MTIKERLMEIAQNCADTAKADSSRIEDPFASYLVTALDLLAAEGLPLKFRAQLVALYIAAYGPVSYKVLNVYGSNPSAYQA